MPYDGPILIGDASENRTENVEHLRALAAWYQEFAEKAANPTIWGYRIATAENLGDARQKLIPDDKVAKSVVAYSRETVTMTASHLIAGTALVCCKERK